MEAERRPNRLINATSPYLRQHAFNPVDWQEWGEEALTQARREDKPIFLSIGYSTCHWCHVMAHQCFEDPEIARIMNEHFVSIKVDREERPDLDEVYMNALQLLTGRGGWPLNIFLTPELKPFYGGTYFPPRAQGEMPGFGSILLALSEAYHQNRDKVANITRSLEERLQTLGEMTGEARDPAPEKLARAVSRLLHDFDPIHGGFGGAPKFPRALELSLLLLYFRLTGEPQVLEKAAFSLDKMAQGGIYDQAGGGFHRYTVDGEWVVPHFEKMLYDNALLVPLYLALDQIKGRDEARRIARETLDFVLRELTAPEGGFYSALDADSEGVEGKFYVWTKGEVDAIVGPENALLAAAALGVTEAGNFEGKNILARPYATAELAEQFSLAPDQVEERLQRALTSLLQAREGRVRPHRDEKIITAWNGLMLSALARGAQVLGDRRYYTAAARGARFIQDRLFREDGLRRIWSQGREAVPGFLDDYAFLAAGLLDLFETDFDPEWLAWARRLADHMEEKFLDPADGSFFYTPEGGETLPVRSKCVFDQAVPSGNSVAAQVMLKLYRFTEEERFLERCRAILSRFQAHALGNPGGFANLLAGHALYLLPPLDLTLVGDPARAEVQQMVAAIYGHYFPERRLLVKNPRDCAALEELAPPARTYILTGKEPAAAYICQAMTCQPAVIDAKELAAKLRQLDR